MTLTQLESDIKAEFAQTEGDFALAFKSLENPGEELLINARESFHVASTIGYKCAIEKKPFIEYEACGKPWG